MNDVSARNAPRPLSPESKQLSDLAKCVLALRKLAIPHAGHLDAKIIAAATQGQPAPVLLALLASKEFRKGFPSLFSGIGYGHDAPEVEHMIPNADLSKLFDHVAAEWEKLGREQPAWSVLSVDRYKDIPTTKIPPAFYKSGESQVLQLVKALRRHGIRPSFAKTVEYGCGIGRITFPLAQRSGHTIAYDISREHLAIAETQALKRKITNIRFEHVNRPDIAFESGYDFYYSSLVYQHNPPPIIRHLIQQALGGLISGGIAVFQVPVFLKGYRFRLGEYLDKEKSGIEMHALPQRIVLDIIDQSNCRVLEIFDSSLNLRDRILSNIFTVQKRR